MKTPEQLIGYYRRRGVLIDTNLLLLYTIGLWNPKQISKFKRTKIFSQEDYLLLCSILREFDRVVTTPNVLTEVSNLAGQLAESFHEGYYAILSKQIEVLDEQYLSSQQSASDRSFARFGLTDITIKIIANHTYLVITEDFKLGQYLQSQTIDVLNFNHLRYAVK